MKSHIIFALLWLVSQNVPAIEISNASRDTSCPELENTYICAQALEKKLIFREPLIISRKDTTLSIKSSANQHYSLKDIDSDPDNEKHYVAVGISSDKRFIALVVQYFEGNSWGIFDRSSNKFIETCGYPLYSPDRQYIAFAEINLWSDFSPNCLDIYEVKINALVKVFSAEPTDWGPEAANWSSSRTLSFRRVTWNPKRGKPEEPDYLSIEQIVSLTGKTWEISARKVTAP